jgi:hypothetical protein
LSFIEPILFEYGKVINTAGNYGGGYQDTAAIFSALYEHFNTDSLTVQSRNITYDTTATLGASNVGNGSMARLTTDQNGFDMEFCHVETKRFRCRQDINSGVREEQEVFEQLGEPASPDALLRAARGSGADTNVTIRSHHAGSGAAEGGSLLTNSSFSDFTSGASPEFTGWTETAVGGGITQDATNYYRSFPNAGTDASLQMTGGGGDIILTQPLSDMSTNQLDPNTPYFLRVMLNKTVGTASGGTVTIRMGSQSASVTIAALGAGWQELLIPLGTANWFRNFNPTAAEMSVVVEWTSSTSGTLLVDDILFAPFDLIDGTYWFLRGNAATHASWRVDDTLEFTDTGGAPATGKIQWWLFVTELGYLPSTTGLPTFTDPL